VGVHGLAVRDPHPVVPYCVVLCAACAGAETQCLPALIARRRHPLRLYIGKFVEAETQAVLRDFEKAHPLVGIFVDTVRNPVCHSLSLALSLSLSSMLQTVCLPAFLTDVCVGCTFARRRVSGGTTQRGAVQRSALPLCAHTPVFPSVGVLCR
jgi:hypothetical protein